MNISNIHNCYGCGLCATVCSHKVIDIRLNQDGFYEPYINRQNACTDCGLCIEVCSFNKETLTLEPPKIDDEVHSYAAWSNDPQVRHKCSSGGVGFELGRAAIAQGYKVCGVRYNAKIARAEHYIATTVEELIPSIGSKYIQSYTVDGFRSINRREKYLITGTPCQIDSFRRYIRKFKVEENFILMDFFCHGVPSMLAWQKYLAMAEKQVGPVTYASWRNKQTGWHDSWGMAIDGEDKCGDKVDWHESYNMLIREKKSFLNSRLSQGDLFYKFFLGHYCMNPACHKECKYKYIASSADIRIGDLWGNTYKDNEEGVSAAIAFTSKGDKWLRQTDCTFVEHPFEVVAEGQMKKNCDVAAGAPIVKYLLRSKVMRSECSWRIVFCVDALLNLFNRAVNKLLRMVKIQK